MPRCGGGGKKNQRKAGIVIPLPCVAESVVRRGRDRSELGGLCDVLFDHSDKRIDRILQQVIQTDSLAGSFDCQHRPLVLGQSDRRLERDGLVGGLRDGAEPFAEDAGGHLGLGLRFGLGLCFHVVLFGS